MADAEAGLALVNAQVPTEHIINSHECRAFIEIGFVCSNRIVPRRLHSHRSIHNPRSFQLRSLFGVSKLIGRIEVPQGHSEGH